MYCGDVLLQMSGLGIWHYAIAPDDVNSYLEIHQSFWYGLNQMQQYVNVIDNIKLSNLKWAGGKKEVGEVCRQTE